MSSWEERYPGLWEAADRLSTVVISGLLFWTFSLGIITIPAALVALFAGVGTLVQPARGETLSRFWQAFRHCFGRATLLGLLDLIAASLLYFDVSFFWALGSPLGRGMAYVAAVIGALLVLVNIYAWPLLAWYPQPLGALLKRSLLLAGAHPLWALGGLGAVVLWLGFCLVLPGPLAGLGVLLGPGVGALGISLAAWQAMKRYAPEEEEEATSPPPAST